MVKERERETEDDERERRLEKEREREKWNEEYVRYNSSNNRSSNEISSLG